MRHVLALLVAVVAVAPIAAQDPASGDGWTPLWNGKDLTGWDHVGPGPTEPWMPVNKGYEVQIDDSEDDYHVTGVLYSLTKALARPTKTADWNTMEITIDGPRTVVRVNGQLVTDYVEGQPVPPKTQKWEPDRGRRPDQGYFGLQNHSSKDIVYFRDVSLKEMH